MRPSRRQTQPFIRRWPAGRLTATALLVALSCGAYVSQLILEFTLPAADARMLWHWLALDGDSARTGQWWKFLSYPLLHAHPVHLLGSMLLLFCAGREVEPIIGARHFVLLYGLAAVVGGAVHALVMPGVPIVGTVPAVVAVIIAYTTILPELEIVVSVFFVLPLKLRAKYLAYAVVGGAAVLWATFTLPEWGPAAMLATSGVAWLYIKQLGFGNPLAIQRYLFARRQRAARLQRMSAEQFIHDEIDPILDKIAREGLQSLSRSERKLLEQGREKIAARSVRKT